MSSLEGRRIWVAGHRGMVGSALMRRLAGAGCTLVTAERSELDLRRQSQVEAFLGDHRIGAIVVAAAHVGGILANETRPAEFLYDNLMIAANIVEAAHQTDVDRLLFLGSSCIYPRDAEQPITEGQLLSGPLEPTNQWYAVAKIAGLKLCAAYRAQHGRDYIAAMPANLYGPGDRFDLRSGHVLPALIRKAHEAKLARAHTLTLWGTGTPRREFLHVDDCADGLVHLLEHYSGAQHINIGSGEEISILELARLVCSVVGFEGEIVHDLGKKDGAPRKLMDSGRLRAMGWRPRIGLREGIKSSYRWFVANVGQPA